MTGYVADVAVGVGSTFATTWPFLAISIVAAAALTTFVGADRIEAVLRTRPWTGIAAAVALAALTPFCSCGTTAVLLGGLAASAPWAPIVAFLVASPLTSPSELVLSAGLFGWEFALVFFVGTIVIGAAAGAATALIDDRGWLAGQARMAVPDGSCGTDACAVPTEPAPAGIGPGTASVLEFRGRRLRGFGRELVTMGRRLLLFFTAFTVAGYLVIEAVPTSLIVQHLGGGSVLAVPLAAVAGIPAYLNTEASLPLVAAMVDGGMGPGPALALVVTGAGTSVAAVTGLLVIARRRVVGLVVALLLVGALGLGWFGQAVL
ncbi:MAG: permease [Acidimicrobiia bacterium]|nr:permease [Acidimicrobiia bacterium]